MKIIFDKKTNNFQIELNQEELELAKTNPESFKILMDQQTKVRELIANNLIQQIKEQYAYRLESEKISADERNKIREQQLESERLNVQKSQFAWDRILYGAEAFMDNLMPDQISGNL